MSLMYNSKIPLSLSSTRIILIKVIFKVLELVAPANVVAAP